MADRQEVIDIFTEALTQAGIDEDEAEDFATASMNENEQS